MYLIINEEKYTVHSRVVKGGTVRYTSVTPTPGAVSGTIRMFRDDGFLMSEDDTAAYARHVTSGSLLVLTNDPEPVPVTPQPTVEQRVAALENAIKEGLSL